MTQLRYDGCDRMRVAIISAMGARACRAVLGARAPRPERTPRPFPMPRPIGPSRRRLRAAPRHRRFRAAGCRRAGHPAIGARYPDGYALDWHGARRCAASPYRNGGTDPQRLRLQRVHPVRVRAVRRCRCRERCAISSRSGQPCRAGTSSNPGDLIFFTTIDAGGVARGDRGRRRRVRPRARARPGSCGSSASARATGRRGSSARGECFGNP